VEEEENYLRRVVIRLRGVLHFAVVPEVQAVIKEVITMSEDRLAELDDATLKSRKR
jgi:hypothetical protein